MHENCQYDYVLVNDTNGAKMGRFCGTNIPPILTTIENEMTVTFITDSSTSMEGFNASYTFLDSSRTCGGDFYSSSGVIRSPGYPESYSHGKSCIWVIHAENGHQIQLNVSSFNIENHADCRFDYLEIRDGGYATSPLRGKFCGTSIPPLFTSHSNLMRLEFHSDRSQTAAGFEIFFDSTTTGCGGLLKSPRGSIISPNYPSPYGHNAECTWLIRVSEGSKIFITLVTIDIERHLRCEFDYIEIFDGNSDNSPSLGRFCNEQQIPGILSSSGNLALIKFRTDMSDSGRGFHLTYQSSCNNEINGRKQRRGVIESPNFPYSYPHNHNCTWKITASPGNNISLAFSHLTLEESSLCDVDFIEVRELYDEGRNNLIANYCASPFPLPAPITTTSNIAVVRFTTDSSVSHDGFRLEWRVIGCGGEITKGYGQINTPGYPFGYPHSIDCYWHIKYSEDKRVELRISDLDIEYATDCIFDYLRVYAGEDENAPRLLNLCNKISEPRVLTSHGNHMVIHFRSDRSVTGKGFMATFRELPSGCGGRYTFNSGGFLSPSYAQSNYNANDQCDWLITIDPMHVVILEFYDFSLPESVNCTYGYVAIYDGQNSSMPLLRRICGDMPVDPVITSTGNEMLVVLRADGEHVGEGFRAHYKPGCGRRIIADYGGEITSPNFPHFSFEHANCSWIIYASDPSEKVTLLITQFRVNLGNDCSESNSALEVRDGEHEDSPIIGRYCGTESPPAIISQGNALHIFLQWYGIFRASYGIVSSHCGGTLTSDSGSFASPSFPDNYPMDAECVWIVKSSAGNLAQITFQSFSLESNAFCNTDYLEIHENDAGGRLIGRYCGNNIPSDPIVANKIWIKFQSDELGTAPGFRAQYNLLHGMQLNATGGVIESPGYPDVHYHGQVSDYEWIISVSENYTVSINFLEMYIRPENADSSICYSAVELFDGFDGTAPSMGQYCGYAVPEPVTSHGNQVLVKFGSNGGYVFGKWKLQWSSVEKSAIVVTEPTIVSESNCFHHLELNISSDIEVLSTNYPEPYEPNTNCTWFVRVSPYEHIKLHVTDLELEGSEGECLYDRLEIYIAPNSNVDSWVLNDTLCGRKENYILDSPNNIVKLVFITDGTVSLSGFKIKVQANCGGLLTESNGVIDSSFLLPYFAKFLTNQYHLLWLTCDWVIKVGVRRTIQINFERFNIPSDDVCSSMYTSLLILNGGETTSPMLGRGKYCGVNIPSIPETSSNMAFIRLNAAHTSDRHLDFKLHYNEISVACGGHLYINEDNLYVEVQSPNYPSPPPHPMECNWVIMSPSGTRLRIDFESEFHLTGDCWDGDVIEHIQIYDGGSEIAEPLYRYCGHSFPSTTYTTGNSMYVTYLTQVEHPGSGFKATIRTATCGGKYYGWYGTIISPDYPSNYTNNLNCEYIVEVKDPYAALISILNLNTPFHSNCTMTDYLEIRDEDKDGEVLGTFCGNMQYQTVRIPGSKAYIRFKSDSSRTGSGFQLNYNADQSNRCGPTSELTGEAGVLTSPNYPNALPDRRTCFWMIQARLGRSVTITFDNFNLPRNEISGTCNSIFQVSNISLHYHRQTSYEICGSDIPTKIQSSSNEMYIGLRTSGLLAGQGFSLSYDTYHEAMCGGELFDQNGTFSSPNFTFVNNSYLFCRWDIDSGSDNRTLVIRFDKFNLNGNLATYCRESSLAVFATDSRRILNFLCGNRTNNKPSFTSPYRKTNLRFLANQSLPYEGFKASYNISDCGGIIRTSDAVIMSPGFPNNYSSNLDCHWQIELPYGERIKLTFLNMSLENNCRKDYVLIANSVHASYPVLGKFCGNLLPEPIVSDNYMVSVIFHSDAYTSGSGFKLTLADVERGCGGVIHMKHGIITSPNYPNKYGSNVECVWEIETTSGHVLNITFLERFDLEMATNCSSDYISIEDYYNSPFRERRQVHRYCGSQRPETFISKSIKLRIKFHSNERIQGDGFKIEYTAVCGGYYSGLRGYILSPNYPESYDNNQHCKYYLGQEGHYTSIVFHDAFSIEEGMDQCPFDYVAIYDGNTTSSNLIGKYCGLNTPPRLLLYGPILIEFISDVTITAPGFVINYAIEECGGVRTKNVGYIRSPSNSSAYLDNLSCRWEIHIPGNYAIRLRFIKFDIEAGPGCMFDYLDIYDGNATTNQLIGRLCGNKKPPIIQTISNQMTLHFVSDHSYAGEGFFASYTKTYGVLQGCGGTIISATGQFSSLDIDNDGKYESNLHCVWKVIGAADQILNITFSKFEIEFFRNNCRFGDFIEIRDGLNLEDPVIDRYCGSTLPSPITTSSNKAVIIFHSDSFDNYPGFTANFISIPTLCGGTTLNVTNITQTLTSPNYPSNYPPNLYCRWHFFVDVPFKGAVAVTFENLDVPCEGDYIEVNAENQFGGKTYRLCGPKYPKEIIVNHGMWMTMSTDGNGSNRGFSLNYKIAGCDRIYSSENGVITNPDFPNSFNFESTCVMKINATVGKTISLYFGGKFIIHPQNQCETSYLKVFDGEDTNSPLLSTMCDDSLPNPIFSTSNWLAIKLSTPYAYFYISYTTTDKGRGCGGVLRHMNGTFSSPLYPMAYSQASECKWEISVPGYNALTLKFDFFALNSTSGCESNYVEIFEGHDDDVQNRIIRLCGNDVPGTYYAGGSQMLVKLVTDATNTAPGFLAHYYMNPLHKVSAFALQAEPTGSHTVQQLGDTRTVYLLQN